MSHPDRPRRLAARTNSCPGSTRLSPSVVCLVLICLLLGTGTAGAARVDVEIEGVTGAVGRNVELMLSLRGAAGDDLPEQRIRRLHARAPGEIALALQPFGYYRPEITGGLEPVEGEGRWRARYVIDPGEPIRLRNVDVVLRGEGLEDDEVQAVFSAFPLAPGDVLLHSRYETGKRAIRFAAADNGYFDAAFDSSAIRIDLTAYDADIVLHFTTGPRYRFGTVELHQEILEPRLLQGHVTFAPGDPFEVEKLLQLQHGLSESAYFSRVEARPRPDRVQDLQVPIEVELVPRSTQRYDIGAGYGTDTGARGTFDLELSRLNRRGHRFEGKLKISEIERSAGGRYVVPSLYPSTAVYSLFAGYAHLDPSASESDKWLLGGSVAHLRRGWHEIFSLSFEHEQFEVGTDAGTADLLLPAVSWTRTRADSRLDTRRGWRLRLDCQGSHEAVLSSVSMLQLHGDAKLIRSLGERTRAIMRVEGGRTFTSSFRQLPATLRYFAGGDQSLRGYEYQSLGPVDDAGDVIGGEIILLGSAEVEYRFLPAWGVALFYDAGNAMSPDATDEVEKGTGAGLRWLSPIGLVRIDGAYAVGSTNMVRLHVSIGPDL